MIQVIFRQFDLQLTSHLEKMNYIITNPTNLHHPLHARDMIVITCVDITIITCVHVYMCIYIHTYMMCTTLYMLQTSSSSHHVCMYIYTHVISTCVVYIVIIMCSYYIIITCVVYMCSIHV